MSTANDMPLQAAEGQSAVGGAFDVISRARRALRAGSDVSAKTAVDYGKKVKLVLDQFAAAKRQGGQASLELILARYAPRARSFRAMRSALVWHFKQQAKKLLEEQDVYQRMKLRDDAWLTVVGKLDQMLKLTGVLEGFNAGDLLTLTGQQKKAGLSKRNTLVKLPADWKQRMIERAARSPTYYLPTLLIAATGCRPEELSDGLDLSVDGGQVVVRWNGAKVSKNSGQPWRQFKLKADVLPEKVLQQVETVGVLKVLIASTDAFRAHLTRHSKELFPNKPLVTGYSFRHSLAEDLREAGWEAEEIAAVLGQSVAETQAMYGRRKRTGSRAPQAVTIERTSVETARPVRPLDRSGLEMVLAEKLPKAARARKSRSP